MKRLWTLAVAALLFSPSAARADRTWALGLGLGPVEFTRDQRDLFDGNLSFGGYGEIDWPCRFGLRGEVGHASFDGTPLYDETVSTRVGSPVTNDLGVTTVLGGLLYRIPLPERVERSAFDADATLYAGIGSYNFHHSRDSALPSKDTPPGVGDETSQTRFGWNAGIGVEFATRAEVSITALYRYHFVLTDEDAFAPSGIGAADDRTDYHEGVFGVKVYFGPGGIQLPGGGD